MVREEEREREIISELVNVCVHVHVLHLLHKLYALVFVLHVHVFDVDMPDGGAEHFAETVRQIKKRLAKYFN